MHNGIKTVGVHKQDAEGILLIDALTGLVVPEQHDRPEWAEGLTIAQLSERHLWWTNRLGHSYTKEMASPEMLAYEDLGWLKMEANEDTAELTEAYEDASEEFRMDLMAQLLDIDRTEMDADAAFSHVHGITASVEIARDDSRTDAEMADFRAAQEGRFEEVRKTGTHD